MKQMIIAGLIFAGALFFLVRRFYRILTGKGSACSCGTHKYTIKNGKVIEQQGCACGCCNCRDGACGNESHNV